MERLPYFSLNSLDKGARSPFRQGREKRKKKRLTRQQHASLMTGGSKMELARLASGRGNSMGKRLKKKENKKKKKKKRET
jgi:hypothetical protein